MVRNGLMITFSLGGFVYLERTHARALSIIHSRLLFFFFFFPNKLGSNSESTASVYIGFIWFFWFSCCWNIWLTNNLSFSFNEWRLLTQIPSAARGKWSRKYCSSVRASDARHLIDSLARMSRNLLANTSVCVLDPIHGIRRERKGARIILINYADTKYSVRRRLGYGEITQATSWIWFQI